MKNSHESLTHEHKRCCLALTWHRLASYFLAFSDDIFVIRIIIANIAKKISTEWRVKLPLYMESVMTDEVKKTKIKSNTMNLMRKLFENYMIFKCTG